MKKIETVTDGWGLLQKFEETYKGCSQHSFGDNEPFLIIDSWEFVKQLNSWLYDMGYDTEPGSEQEDAISFLTDGNWGFDDDCAICSRCGKEFTLMSCGRSNFWYDIQTGKTYCRSCIEKNEEFKAEYLEKVIVSSDTGLSPIRINEFLTEKELKEKGFALVQDNLEVGMYGVYIAPRKKLQTLLEEHPQSEFIYSCNCTNPLRFSIWMR